MANTPALPKAIADSHHLAATKLATEHVQKALAIHAQAKSGVEIPKEARQGMYNAVYDKHRASMAAQYIASRPKTSAADDKAWTDRVDHGVKHMKNGYYTRKGNSYYHPETGEGVNTADMEESVSAHMLASGSAHPALQGWQDPGATPTAPKAAVHSTSTPSSEPPKTSVGAALNRAGVTPGSTELKKLAPGESWPVTDNKHVLGNVQREQRLDSKNRASAGNQTILSAVDTTRNNVGARGASGGGQSSDPTAGRVQGQVDDTTPGVAPGTKAAPPGRAARAKAEGATKKNGGAPAATPKAATSGPAAREGKNDSFNTGQGLPSGVTDQMPRHANVQISPVNTTEPTARASHKLPAGPHDAEITNPDMYIPNSPKAQAAGLNVNPKAMRPIKGSTPEGQATTGAQEWELPGEPVANPAPQAPVPAGNATPAAPNAPTTPPADASGGNSRFVGNPNGRKGMLYGPEVTTDRPVMGRDITYTHKKGETPGTRGAETPVAAKQREGYANHVNGGGNSDSYWAERDAAKAGKTAKAAAKTAKAAPAATSTPAAQTPTRGEAFTEGSSGPAAQSPKSGWPVTYSDDVSKTGRSPQGTEARELGQKGRLDLNLPDRWGASDTPAPTAPAASAGRTGRTSAGGGTPRSAAPRSNGSGGGGAARGTGFSVGDNNSGDFSNVGNTYNIHNHNISVGGDVNGSSIGNEGGGGGGPRGGTAPRGRAAVKNREEGPKADAWITTAQGTASARGTFDSLTGRSDGAGKRVGGTPSGPARGSESRGGQQNDISTSSRRARTAVPDGGTNETGSTRDWRGPQYQAYQSPTGNGTANGAQN